MVTGQETAQTASTAERDDTQHLIALLRTVIRSEVLAAVMEAELITRELGSRVNIKGEIERLRAQTKDAIIEITKLANSHGD